MTVKWLGTGESIIVALLFAFRSAKAATFAERKATIVSRAPILRVFDRARARSFDSGSSTRPSHQFQQYD